MKKAFYIILLLFYIIPYQSFTQKGKKVKAIPVVKSKISSVANCDSCDNCDNCLTKGLQWRNIGPFRAGRSLAVAGVVSQPLTYYFGATGGGVWKSTDGGGNWASISDSTFKSSSVGAIWLAGYLVNGKYINPKFIGL